MQRYHSGAGWIVGADAPPSKQEFPTSEGVVTIQPLQPRKSTSGKDSWRQQKKEKKERVKKTPPDESKSSRIVIQPVIQPVEKIADDDVATRFAAIESRQDALERKVDAQGTSIASLESTMTGNFSKLFDLLGDGQALAADRKKLKSTASDEASQVAA